MLAYLVVLALLIAPLEQFLRVLPHTKSTLTSASTVVLAQVPAP